MRFFKKERADIQPLSSNPELDSKKVPGINVYYSDLNEAFHNPRMKNIAITGQRGVGKSSLIKSFDSTQRSAFGRTPKFLYVSLGKYHDDQSKSVDLNGNHQGHGIIEEKNAVEHRILLQLCSKFTDKDFPASGFRLIPKQPIKLEIATFVVFIMSILLLMMKKKLAELMHQLELNPLHKKLVEVIEWIFKWNAYIEVLLYVIIFIGVLTILGVCYRRIRLKWIDAKLAVKTSNVEWNMEDWVPKDYLDQYTQELIYCLSQVGKKIDRTVVFEDMDRLDEEICVQVFTRLREINHILNAHLDVGRYIRFVFVIDDRIANCLHYDKFFDYVMPVIPILNRSSSEVIFRENLKKVNRELERTIKFEQLHSDFGAWGANVVVFLDRHPLLKESCCHIRGVCKAGTGMVITCITEIASKIGGFLQKHPSLNRIILVPQMTFKWIYRCVKTGADIVGKYIHMFSDFLAKCPVVRYLFMRLAKRKANICSWIQKQKALLCYNEVNQNCACCDKNSTDSSSCIRRIENDFFGILELTAGMITDYRLMFTILNEYSLMMRVYHSNNQRGIGCKTAEQILAFQIYKHLWPQDYQNLLAGDIIECALYTKNVNHISSGNKELLQKMLDQNMLSIETLDYAGFSRSKINNLWICRMKSELLGTVLASMDPTNSNHQRVVQDYCSINEDGTSNVDVSVLPDAIRFVLKCNVEKQKEDEWFFKKRDIITCLQAMAELKEDEYTRFIQRNRKTDDDDIFSKCTYGSNRRKYLHGNCTELMARIYVMGVPFDDINGVYMLIKGGNTQRLLTEFVKKEGQTE